MADPRLDSKELRHTKRRVKVKKFIFLLLFQVSWRKRICGCVTISSTVGLNVEACVFEVMLETDLHDINFLVFALY